MQIGSDQVALATPDSARERSFLQSGYHTGYGGIGLRAELHVRSARDVHEFTVYTPAKLPPACAGGNRTYGGTFAVIRTAKRLIELLMTVVGVRARGSGPKVKNWFYLLGA